MQEAFLLDRTGSAVKPNKPLARNLSSLLRAFYLSTFVSGGQRRRNQLIARGFGGKLAAGGGHRKVGRSGRREGSRDKKPLYRCCRVSGKGSLLQINYAAARLPSVGVITGRSSFGASLRNAGTELEAKSQTLFIRCRDRSCDAKGCN